MVFGVRRLLVLLLSSACQSPRAVASAPRNGSIETNPDQDQVAADAGAPERASCSVAAGQSEPVALGSIVHVADLAGQRWFVGGRQGNEGSLVHLDTNGHVVTQQLPAWSEHVSAIEPATLRFLVTTDAPRWWTVNVHDPDAPAMGEPVPVSDLAPGRYPKGFAADESRAVISMYDENPSDAGPRYVGRTALYEVPSGKRLSPELSLTAWAAECSAGRCFALASPNDASDQVELVEIAAAGERRVSPLTHPGATFRDGATWLVLDCAPAGGVVIAVALADGKIRRKLLDVPAEQCQRLRPVWLGHGSGLVARTVDGVDLLTVDHELRATTTHLAAVKYWTQDYAPVSDGLLVVDYDNRTAMVHSPTDRKIRRYFSVWEFVGRAGFARGGALSDVTRLPHDGENGRFTRGYQAVALSRGAHATALVVGWNDSVAVRLREPCSP
jgi:hypothetical protein